MLYSPFLLRPSIVFIHYSIIQWSIELSTLLRNSSFLFFFLSFPSVLSFCRISTLMPSSKMLINSVTIHDPKEETPRLLICRVEEKMFRSSNERARCVINEEAFEKKRTRQKRKSCLWCYEHHQRDVVVWWSRLSAHKELFMPMSSVQVIDSR